MEKPAMFSGAVIIKQGLYLFGKRSANRSSYAGVWDIIGGHIEPNEVPEDALRRECEEEVGIVPTAFQLFKTIEQSLDSAHGMLSFYIYFVTAWTGGEPVNCSAEHSEIKWLSRHELDALTLASSEYLNLIDEWENNSGGQEG